MKKLLLVSFCCLLTMQAAWAQGKRITGQVTSQEDNSALPGVNVLLKGTSNGTTTDVDGKYALNVDDPNGTLVFSYIGFTSQEVAIAGKSAVDVVLLPDIKSLSEVVVVGYGTQKKTDLTGSVSQVTSGQIKQVPVASLDQALQGRAAGVQVTQASSAPGGGVSIRIRGGNSINASNEPLYVIDGIPIFPSNSTFAAGTNGGVQAQNALANLNPGDIESMEILKDASATAIYGSRGANGVVLISTKRGKAGQTNVDFESYYGVQQVARKLDLLNARQFAELRNEADASAGRPLTFTPEQIAGFGEGTDWQDAIFRTAPIQNYQITFSGGNEGTRYAVSGNYFDQQGIILNSGFRRASFRANLDKKISERLNVGNSLQVSRAYNDQVLTDLTRGGVVNAALVFSPTLPVYDANGEYTFDNSSIPGQQQVGNPVALANENVNLTVTNRILGNFFGDYKIIEGLNARLSVGIDYQAARRDSYAPSTINRGRNARGDANAEKKDVISPVFTGTLTYNRNFTEAHKLNLLAGYETQSQVVDYVQASAQNFATDNTQANNLQSGGIIGTPNTGKSKWRLDSWFGRANYTLLDKYLFTATFRADGSSRFGTGNKWGFFPSGAIGWRLSEEAFIRDLGWFSNLKLTASYGLTGNQEIGLYQSLPNLGLSRYPFGDAPLVGLQPGRIGNQELRWEKTAQYNAGLEAGILQNRINLEANIYYKKTQDLLLTFELPRTSGYSTYLQNLGSVENRGLELAVNSQNLVGEFKWTTSANITFNRNKLLELAPGETFRFAGEGDGHLQISNFGILQVGRPVGSFFGFRTDGIYQTGESVITGNGTTGAGDIRYLDLTGDGRITNADRTIIGNPQPDFFYGFTNNFSYKGLTLDVFFQGVYGNDVLNVNTFELENLNGSSNNSTRVLERWTPANPSNTMPSAKTRPFVLSDRQIEDASYLRLRNITLGYNLPVSGLGIAWLRSIRIYAQGQNLFTVTNYSGYDPEVNSAGQNSTSLGIDRGTFPLAKMYTFGINLGL